jgi:TonB family protein
MLRPFSSALVVLWLISVGTAAAQDAPKPAVQEAAKPVATLQKPADGTYPSGRVVIAYSLEQAAGRVDIDVVDAKGAVVAGWTGGAAGQAAGQADRFALPEPLTKPGTHSIAWDLHASGYVAAGDPPGFLPGPLVPPGAYVARLTALGQTTRQGFKVTAESPLSPARQADLEARFELAMQIRGGASAASAAVKRVRAQKARVAERLARGADSATREAGTALTRRLTDLEGVAGQEVSASSGVGPLHEALAALLREVEAGGRPTGAQATRFGELAAALQSRIVELNALTSGSFARFERGETLPSGPSGAAFGAAAIQLDRKGVDFDAWVTSYVSELKRRWIIPAALSAQKGRVVVTLVVLTSGVVTGIDIASPSDVPAFNESARGAVLAASPAPPLPEKYPGESCRMTVTFYFNELPQAGGRK